MVTLKEDSIIIEIQEPHFGAESISLLTAQLIDVLDNTIASSSLENIVIKNDYWMLFQLLKALSPTLEQLKMIHEDSTIESV